MDWRIYNVALADDYIIACSDDNCIHVWNRSTGDKMVYKWRVGTRNAGTRNALADVHLDENEELDLSCPLYFSVHGNILVSTSRKVSTSSFFSCAICIWNMKTGRLLKRYDDGDKWIDDGTMDISDIVYLKHLNGLACIADDMSMNVWSFPTTQRQYDMAISIRQREVANTDRYRRRWAQ